MTVARSIPFLTKWIERAVSAGIVPPLFVAVVHAVLKGAAVISATVSPIRAGVGRIDRTIARIGIAISAADIAPRHRAPVTVAAVTVAAVTVAAVTVAAITVAAVSVAAVSVAVVRDVALVTFRVSGGKAGAERLTIPVYRPVFPVIALVAVFIRAFVLISVAVVLLSVLLSFFQPFSKAVVVSDPPGVVVRLLGGGIRTVIAEPPARLRLRRRGQRERGNTKRGNKQ